MATKTNWPDRRPVEITPLFIPYQLPAAALSRTTTNIRCGVRDPANILKRPRAMNYAIEMGEMEQELRV
jgi:hypothetical protein